jgi:hypothetical protein
VLTIADVRSEIAEGWVGQNNQGGWWRAGWTDASPIFLRRVESLLTSRQARFSDRWLDTPEMGPVRLLEVTA